MSSSAPAQTPLHHTALAGARIAFTGRLASMPRAEAESRITHAGGTITTSLSRKTTHLVIGMHGWPLRPDGSLSPRLKQAERLRQKHGHLAIISEIRLLELLGCIEQTSSVSKSYSLAHVAEVIGVEPETIERWEYLGLLRSHHGCYDFQDIISLQTIAALVKDGVHPQTIRSSLDSLAAFVSGTERPLAQLCVVAAESGELLAQVNGSLVAPDGQQFLDFECHAPTSDTLTSRDRPGAESAPTDTGVPRGMAIIEPKPVNQLERAIAFERDEQYEAAAACYRQAIVDEPRSVEAMFNLGNVLRMMGNDGGAQAMYELALAFDPSNELVWYNLADVQEEAEDFAQAIASLRNAIAIDPSFADAHFNLASCLESTGDHAGAKQHWQTYLSLDPASTWADIARRNCGRG
ncbi:MAG: tetratricopeptide repeat protein [Phycisphaerales bacterium]